MIESIPFPLLLALILCLPIWGITEGADEVLKRAGVKERWWGWLLLRLVPPLAGVAVCTIPGFVDLLREDLLGLPIVDVSVWRLVGYGVLAGFVAQILHAWGLRPGVEAAVKAFATAKLKLPTAVLLALLLSACGTVTVQAQQEGRCRIKAAAPFEVRCWSDNKEVLVWTGPMALEVHDGR